MAEASISVDQDQFSCPVCLDLLNDPVTIPCGHSFCMVCINGCWDQESQKGVYSCPQCREVFTPRPGLRRNYFIAEMLEKLKKPEVQATSLARGYAACGDVECDFCTGRKLKATMSCLVCRVSFCETHLKPHYEVLALKTHKLVKASTRLQENICSKHEEVVKVYCRTDHRFICYLCTMHEHKGHDTIATVEERKEKQTQLKYVQMEVQQRILEYQRNLLEVRQAVDFLKSSAQAAVEDGEMIFTELINSIEKKRLELIELIRAQEKAQLSVAEGLMEKLEKKIADLEWKHTRLEQLSHTEDHISFIKSFQSLNVSSRSEDSSTYDVNNHLSFDSVRKSLSCLKEKIEYFCMEEFSKIGTQASVIQVISSPVPKTKKEFLQYFRHLTLDPNTANHHLVLSKSKRAVRWSDQDQHYPVHPERFDSWPQVLCKESVCGRCYWEVEWSGGTGLEWVYISVSYKGINRKGKGVESALGNNNKSWSLGGDSSFTFWHNNITTKLPGLAPSRVGVYLDHNAGTLSFYNAANRMTLLHRVQTTFTEPLYPGFWLGSGSLVKLCDP